MDVKGNSQFQGKVALVSGGTRGIGFNVSRRLVTEGAFVYVTGRNEEAGIKAQAELGENARQYYSVPIPTLLLLLIVCSRLLPLLSSLQKSYQQLLHKVPSLLDVEQMRRSCQQHQEHLTSANVKVSFKDKLVARNITYQYPTKTDPVFKNLSLSIARNEMVALVGPSGSGKSTLADILGGLLLPVDGQIVCDDVEINQTNLLAWRSRVAYVTQEVYLFHDTIRYVTT